MTKVKAPKGQQIDLFTANKDRLRTAQQHEVVTLVYKDIAPALEVFYKKHSKCTAAERGQHGRICAEFTDSLSRIAKESNKTVHAIIGKLGDIITANATNGIQLIRLLKITEYQIEKPTEADFIELERLDNSGGKRREYILKHGRPSGAVLLPEVSASLPILLMSELGLETGDGKNTLTLAELKELTPSATNMADKLRQAQGLLQPVQRFTDVIGYVVFSLFDNSKVKEYRGTPIGSNVDHGALGKSGLNITTNTDRDLTNTLALAIMTAPEHTEQLKSAIQQVRVNPNALAGVVVNVDFGGGRLRQAIDVSTALSLVGDEYKDLVLEKTLTDVDHKVMVAPIIDALFTYMHKTGNTSGILTDLDFKEMCEAIGLLDVKKNADKQRRLQQYSMALLFELNKTITLSNKGNRTGYTRPLVASTLSFEWTKGGYIKRISGTIAINDQLLRNNRTALLPSGYFSDGATTPESMIIKLITQNHAMNQNRMGDTVTVPRDLLIQAGGLVTTDKTRPDKATQQLETKLDKIQAENPDFYRAWQFDSKAVKYSFSFAGTVQSEVYIKKDAKAAKKGSPIGDRVRADIARIVKRGEGVTDVAKAAGVTVAALTNFLDDRWIEPADFKKLQAYRYEANKTTK